MPFRQVDGQRGAAGRCARREYQRRVRVDDVAFRTCRVRRRVRFKERIAVGDSTVVGAAPFYARLVETALREVDKGVVEATQAMGGSTFQIVTRALLPEALPGVIAGATVTAIALVSYTAMAGVVGAGGLGDLAVRFGYQRFQTDVMVVTVVLLLVLVQILQMIGDRLVTAVSHR